MRGDGGNDCTAQLYSVIISVQCVYSVIKSVQCVSSRGYADAMSDVITKRHASIWSLDVVTAEPEAVSICRALTSRCREACDSKTYCVQVIIKTQAI